MIRDERFRIITLNHSKYVLIVDSSVVLDVTVLHPSKITKYQRHNTQNIKIIIVFFCIYTTVIFVKNV